MKNKEDKDKKIKTMLAKEIVLDTSDNKKLTFVPLNGLYKIYIDNKLSLILFTLELATSQYFYNGVIKNKPIKLAEKDKKELDLVIKLITLYNRQNYKDYLIIEVADDKIIIKSVYNRIQTSEIEELFNRSSYIQ